MGPVILSLLACLHSNPNVCQTVFPSTISDDGREMTFFECLGTGGMESARGWLKEHPQYFMRKYSCTVSNNPRKSKGMLEDQPV